MARFLVIPGLPGPVMARFLSFLGFLGLILVRFLVIPGLPRGLPRARFQASQAGFPGSIPASQHPQDAPGVTRELDTAFGYLACHPACPRAWF